MSAKAWVLDAAGRTDIGRTRVHNEDQFLIGSTKRLLDVEQSSLHDTERRIVGATEGNLLMVADGMGGLQDGDLASATAIEAMAEAVCAVMPFIAHRVDRGDASSDYQAAPADSLRPPAPRTGGTPSVTYGMRRNLQTAVERSNESVRRVAHQVPSGGNIGTTLTVAYIVWPILYIAHVGDSRCYLQSGGKLRCLTRDHTVAARLEAAGHEVEERSHLHHTLWNALGSRAGSLRGADLDRVTLFVGDSLLLCSDGLNKHVSDGEIAELLSEDGSAADRCNALVDLAVQRGGSDNVTVVVGRIHAPA